MYLPSPYSDHTTFIFFHSSFPGIREGVMTSDTFCEDFISAKITGKQTKKQAVASII
jgi:hypothetical protein